MLEYTNKKITLIERIGKKIAAFSSRKKIKKTYLFSIVSEVFFDLFSEKDISITVDVL